MENQNIRLQKEGDNLICFHYWEHYGISLNSTELERIRKSIKDYLNIINWGKYTMQDYVDYCKQLGSDKKNIFKF